MILIIRFITTIYVTIKDEEIIINNDFFIKSRIKVNEISDIVMNRGYFSYGRIVLKDGRKLSFNDNYLTKEGRLIFKNLARKNDPEKDDSIE